MDGMQTRSYDENYVRLSVFPNVWPNNLGNVI